MANISQKEAGELVKKLESARNTISRNKEKIREGAERTMHTAIAIGGGAAVGVARSQWGEGFNDELNLFGTDIDADLAAGVVLLGLGITGMAGKASDSITALGTGVMSGYAAFEGKRLMDERKK